jgi:hypothetical protein
MVYFLSISKISTGSALPSIMRRVLMPSEIILALTLSFSPLLDLCQRILFMFDLPDAAISPIPTIPMTAATPDSITSISNSATTSPTMSRPMVKRVLLIGISFPLLT